MQRRRSIGIIFGSWNFIHDSTMKGGSFRALSVVDTYTREVYELHPARNMRSGKVLELLGELIDRHGAPAHIRSDNDKNAGEVCE